MTKPIAILILTASIACGQGFVASFQSGAAVRFEASNPAQCLLVNHIPDATKMVWSVQNSWLYHGTEPVGYTGYAISRYNALAWNAGDLWLAAGFGDDYLRPNLYRMNIVTGHAELWGEIGFDGRITGLAAVPEPPVVAIMLLGLLLFKL